MSSDNKNNPAGSNNQPAPAAPAPAVPAASQVNNADQPGPLNIEPYTSYRNALHGLSPVWTLPELDKNVKISFPEISS
ncbi:hypothetical protein MNBD_GAMMA08-824 [hydrothermal vent metagenome]|uniref:Uncharacterized protein n=1 Tax=hydrothermal vent metagenome TaxID=652676 RepID=A0A3B0WQI7_9ZZZZ